MHQSLSFSEIFSIVTGGNNVDNTVNHAQCIICMFELKTAKTAVVYYHPL